MEANNDFTKWHSSSIEFSDELSVRPPSLRQPLADSTSACTCVLSYSPALVTELSESLAQERTVHKLALEDSEQRIASLHSRIAARDAEIARRALACHCAPPKPTKPPSARRRMSDEEHTLALFHLQEMNRSLEHDIDLLKHKVQQLSRTTRYHMIDICISRNPGIVPSLK